MFEIPRSWQPNDPDDERPTRYESLPFWGGPFDGQTNEVPERAVSCSYPMWQYNPNHLPITYQELYQRDGQIMRYRGKR